jgi:hypothetical protein
MSTSLLVLSLLPLLLLVTPWIAALQLQLRG